MLGTLFWIFCGLVALAAIFLIIWRDVKIVFFLLTILLLGIGGIFILLNNIFIGIVYLCATAVIIFSSYVLYISYENISFIQKRRPSFVQSSVYFIFSIFFFFTLLTAVLSGKNHYLKMHEGFGNFWVDANLLRWEMVTPVILMIVAFITAVLGILPSLKKGS